MNNLRKVLDPYIRLGRYDKPTGGWLAFWPVSYGTVLASSYGSIDLFFMSCGLAASFMLRAGGCAANDLWDRKIDQQVERTKSRPIASGEISPLKAIGFCAFHMIPLPVSYFIYKPQIELLFYMTTPIIVLYPLAKRYLKQPQAVLGIAMNYGFLFSYAVLTQQVDWVCLPVMTGMWCWTMLYDTIYAFQDVKCDKKIGNNSTAIAWEGKYEKYFEWLTVGMGTSYALAGYLAGLGSVYYPALAFCIWRFSRTWIGLDLNDSKACLQSFKKNQAIGGYFFLALLIGKLGMKKEEKGKKEEMEEKKGVLDIKG